MLPDLRLEEEFFERLTVWDAALARQVAAARCAHCGGPLHQANYLRKPRGGARAEGGEALRLRHSQRGYPIVYTAATPSLAALETLVHVDPALAPSNMRLLEIDIPDELVIEDCDPEKIVAGWSVYPAPPELQDFGSQWLASLRCAARSGSCNAR